MVVINAKRNDSKKDMNQYILFSHIFFPFLKAYYSKKVLKLPFKTNNGDENNSPPFFYLIIIKNNKHHDLNDHQPENKRYINRQ